MKNIFYQIAFVLFIVLSFVVCQKCCGDNDLRQRKNNEKAMKKTSKIDSVAHVTDVSLLTASDAEELDILANQPSKRALTKTKTKHKDVQRLNELATETNLSVKIDHVTDTIVKHDTVFLHTKSNVDYSDDWCDVAIREQEGSLYADIRLRDSITIIAKRKRKKILWGLIKVRTKQIEVEAVNECPYSYINYAKEIKLNP